MSMSNHHCHCKLGRITHKDYQQTKAGRIESVAKAIQHQKHCPFFKVIHFVPDYLTAQQIESHTPCIPANPEFYFHTIGNWNHFDPAGLFLLISQIYYGLGPLSHYVRALHRVGIILLLLVYAEIEEIMFVGSI